MFEKVLKWVLGSAMFEKFVGTKVLALVAALLVILFNHTTATPDQQASIGRLVTDGITGLVAAVFMIARAWTDTTAIQKGKP